MLRAVSPPSSGDRASGALPGVQLICCKGLSASRCPRGRLRRFSMRACRLWVTHVALWWLLVLQPASRYVRSALAAASLVVNVAAWRRFESFNASEQRRLWSVSAPWPSDKKSHGRAHEWNQGGAPPRLGPAGLAKSSRYGLCECVNLLPRNRHSLSAVRSVRLLHISAVGGRWRCPARDTPKVPTHTPEINAAVSSHERRARGEGHPERSGSRWGLQRPRGLAAAFELTAGPFSR